MKKNKISEHKKEWEERADMMNYNLSKEDAGKAGAADLTAISLERFSEDEKKK